MSRAVILCRGGRESNLRGILQEVTRKKQEFVDRLANAPDKSYYAVVKKLSGPTPKKAWEVTWLFPNVSPESASAEILVYFAGIGGDEQPSRWPNIPGDGGGDLNNFEAIRVEELLKKHKRVRSRGDGDPLPHLVPKYPHLFAAPIAAIFD